MNFRSSLPSFPLRIFSNLLICLLVTSCETTSTVTLVPEATISTFYLDQLPFSYGVFETEATSVRFEVLNTVPEIYADYADISIDNGKEIKTYQVSAGQTIVVHAMSTGRKQIIVTSGAQVKIDGKITGIFIKEITFNALTVQVVQHKKRIVVYGDSIAGGGNVRDPSAEAWPLLLRKDFSVIVDAYGFRTLYDDASTLSQRSEFASRISSLLPDYIWLAIGTNDFAASPWTASEFGAAYAETLICFILPIQTRLCLHNLPFYAQTRTQIS